MNESLLNYTGRWKYRLIKFVLISSERKVVWAAKIMDRNNDSRNQNSITEDLIVKYFSYGFQHKEILAFLSLLHNIKISLRTLKRILSSLELYRRKNYSRVEDVANYIRQEVMKSGQLHGYKWMHLRCIQNNFVITQDIVRELLRLLDPEGVEVRKRKRLRRRQYYNKGPNYLWHMDSYDKLKPYGICINGCIDGYSRHIIWLRVGSTSSDPKVIGGYFLDAVKMVGGCPQTMRCDMGTENNTVEKMQKTLHSLLNEATTSRPHFIYGKSTHNQRIEAWWSILRKHNTQFWMNLFQSMKEDNLFDGSFIDKALLQFCFSGIIQRDFDQVVLEWNVHRIRTSRNSISPSGRPAIMFEMPSLYNTYDCLLHVPTFVTDELSSECTFLDYPCDRDVYDLCNILMAENNLHHADDPYLAVQLYTELRQSLLNILN